MQTETLTPAQQILQLREENIDCKIEKERLENKIKVFQHLSQTLSKQIEANNEQIKKLTPKVNGSNNQ